jgi:hypothetical protein
MSASATRSWAAAARAEFNWPSSSVSNFASSPAPPAYLREERFFVGSHVPSKLFQTERTATPAPVEQRASSPVQIEMPVEQLASCLRPQQLWIRYP